MIANEQLSSLLKSSKEDPSSSSPETATQGRRGRIPAALIPLGLVLGFVVLVAVVLGERLLPGRNLEMVNVVTLRADVDTEAVATSTTDPWSAPMLFQASGWVEPDPLPIKATALVDGVVERVEVLEGEEVEKGQLLAVLIDEDARLDLQTAESRLASLQAQAHAHHGILRSAEGELETLKRKLEAEEARLAELDDLASRRERAPNGTVSEGEIVQARLKLSTQKAEIAALASTEQELQGSLQQHQAMELDFDARIAEVKTEVARRQLALDRTRIEASVDGIVLRLHVVPGQKRMLGMDDPDSATIATLYQPDHLQARIDVPLEEAAQLAGGQPVRIRSNLLPNEIFQGRVTRIVGEADLQRNTLQAKVRIDNPDRRLRPEMLCRAEFLAPTAEVGSSDHPAQTTGGLERVKVFVPTGSITNESGNKAQVWVLDQSGRRVIPREVELGAERQDEHRLVQSGIKPGERVVLNPPADLKAGQRIKL